jgi:hypothetical protein
VPPEQMFDVFLPHHSADKPAVELLAHRLEDEAGLHPFLDKWHLTPGSPWQEELERALDHSHTCAVFIGPSGMGSWENEEMRSALDDRVKRPEFRVVPVLLPGATMPERGAMPRFLSRLTWVDFRRMDGVQDAEAFRRLVAGIRGVAPGRDDTSAPTASTFSGDFTIRGVTIQQYFGDTRRSDPASRNRRAMIEKVWAIWITGVLQPSLPHDILLDLGLTERPVMVTRALDVLVQRPDLADHVQAPGTRLIDVFDRLDRALLILGAPGAGKTTLLLTLAQDLLVRAAQDSEQPIPVVFLLSSWAAQRRPLADWLVEALSEQYQVPRKTGRTWVEADQILPLLDGLNEVRAEARAACVEAINAFRQDHGLLPLVVCSRVADYETLGIRLWLHGTVVVQSLTPSQVESYLIQMGQPLTAMREALGDDSTLWELLDTPLMLTIMSLAYAGEPVGALRTHGTPEARRHDLFAAYVDRMFHRRDARTRYTRQQTERWLTWLAWQMTQHSQTVFLLERMQPDWLFQRQRWVPTQGTRLVAGLGLGLVYWLLAGLGGGLGAGLFFGLGAGLGTGLGAGLGTGLGAGLLVGVLVGLHVMSLGWLGSELVGGVGFGVLAGLIYKLYAGLVAGLSSGEIATKARPNEGIHRSARMALVVGLGAGVLAGLLAGLGFGLGGGLLVGPAIGIRYGGRTCLQHLFLRLGLRFNGSAPWQYVDFLDYAAERIFLRKVGGGYSFIHRLLQDHFAARYAEPGNDAHPETAGQGQSAPS